MIRLRITPEGRVRGLWTDAVEFAALGHSHVRRASHVEFDESAQRWIVREAVPDDWWRRWLQSLTGRPWGRILHHSRSRRDAPVGAATFRAGRGGLAGCAETPQKRLSAPQGRSGTPSVLRSVEGVRRAICAS